MSSGSMSPQSLPERYRAGMLRRRATCPHNGLHLPVTMWYPTLAGETPGREGIFDIRVAYGARPEPGRYGLVLLSHGSGGSDLNHHDWAEALARAGFVVAAPKHVGDSHDAQVGMGSREQVLERPRQLKCALETALADPDLGPYIDEKRMGVMGFSAGAYTSLILLGALPDFSRWHSYCRDHSTSAVVCPAGRSPKLPEATFEDWSGVEEPRLRAAVLAAPFAMLFDAASAARVTAPVLLIMAEGESVAGNAANGELLAAHLGRAPEIETVAGDHYVFIAPLADEMARMYPEYYVDVPGVDRRAIHADLARRIVDFFSRMG